MRPPPDRRFMCLCALLTQLTVACLLHLRCQNAFEYWTIILALIVPALLLKLCYHRPSASAAAQDQARCCPSAYTLYMLDLLYQDHLIDQRRNWAAHHLAKKKAKREYIQDKRLWSRIRSVNSVLDIRKRSSAVWSVESQEAEYSRYIRQRNRHTKSVKLVERYARRHASRFNAARRQRPLSKPAINALNLVNGATTSYFDNPTNAKPCDDFWRPPTYGSKLTKRLSRAQRALTPSSIDLPLAITPVNLDDYVRVVDRGTNRFIRIDRNPWTIMSARPVGSSDPASLDDILAPGETALTSPALGAFLLKFILRVNPNGQPRSNGDLENMFCNFLKQVLAVSPGQFRDLNRFQIPHGDVNKRVMHLLHWPPEDRTSAYTQKHPAQFLWNNASIRLVQAMFPGAKAEHTWVDLYCKHIPFKKTPKGNLDSKPYRADKDARPHHWLFMRQMIGQSTAEVIIGHGCHVRDACFDWFPSLRFERGGRWGPCRLIKIGERFVRFVLIPHPSALENFVDRDLLQAVIGIIQEIHARFDVTTSAEKLKEFLRTRQITVPRVLQYSDYKVDQFRKSYNQCHALLVGRGELPHGQNDTIEAMCQRRIAWTHIASQDPDRSHRSRMFMGREAYPCETEQSQLARYEARRVASRNRVQFKAHMGTKARLSELSSGSIEVQQEQLLADLRKSTNEQLLQRMKALTILAAKSHFRSSPTQHPTHVNTGPNESDDYADDVDSDQDDIVWDDKVLQLAFTNRYTSSHLDFEVDQLSHIKEGSSSSELATEDPPVIRQRTLDRLTTKEMTRIGVPAKRGFVRKTGNAIVNAVIPQMGPHDKEVYFCPEEDCLIPYFSRMTLREHYHTKHDHSYWAKCRQCGDVLSSRFKLQRHFAVLHPSSDRLQAAIADCDPRNVQVSTSSAGDCIYHCPNASCNAKCPLFLDLLRHVLAEHTVAPAAEKIEADDLDPVHIEFDSFEDAMESILDNHLAAHRVTGRNTPVPCPAKLCTAVSNDHRSSFRKHFRDVHCISRGASAAIYELCRRAVENNETNTPCPVKGCNNKPFAKRDNNKHISDIHAHYMHHHASLNIDPQLVIQGIGDEERDLYRMRQLVEVAKDNLYYCPDMTCSETFENKSNKVKVIKHWIETHAISKTEAQRIEAMKWDAVDVAPGDSSVFLCPDPECDKTWTLRMRIPEHALNYHARISQKLLFETIIRLVEAKRGPLSFPAGFGPDDLVVDEGPGNAEKPDKRPAPRLSVLDMLARSGGALSKKPSKVQKPTETDFQMSDPLAKLHPKPQRGEQIYDIAEDNVQDAPLLKVMVIKDGWKEHQERWLDRDELTSLYPDLFSAWKESFDSSPSSNKADDVEESGEGLLPSTGLSQVPLFDWNSLSALDGAVLRLNQVFATRRSGFLVPIDRPNISAGRFLLWARAWHRRHTESWSSHGARDFTTTNLFHQLPDSPLLRVWSSLGKPGKASDFVVPAPAGLHIADDLDQSKFFILILESGESLETKRYTVIPSEMIASSSKDSQQSRIFRLKQSMTVEECDIGSATAAAETLMTVFHNCHDQNGTASSFRSGPRSWRLDQRYLTMARRVQPALFLDDSGEFERLAEDTTSLRID